MYESDPGSKYGGDVPALSLAIDYADGPARRRPCTKFGDYWTTSATT